MSAGPHPAAVAQVSRLAAAVSGLGDEAWDDELAGLGAAPTAGDAGPPTYELLASAGVDAVDALARDGAWDEAARQADRLTAFFRARTRHIHPVAAESFDGLRAAARARDPEELADFVELLRELFGDRGG